MRRIIHHAPNSGEASVRLVCLRKPIRISRSWIPVMPELMGMKNVLVLNDEAHHCYREKPDDTEFTDEQGNKLTGEELRDAKTRARKDNEAARVWISGLESVNRKLGVARVVDLSATPFFLSGSGYAEGTLFPWTVSDFSLMDAIECGIVKLPRVPVAQNLAVATDDEMPMFRKTDLDLAKVHRLKPLELSWPETLRF